MTATNIFDAVIRESKKHILTKSISEAEDEAKIMGVISYFFMGCKTDIENQDDELIAATNNELVDTMVKYLKDNFEMKEGELDHFLGIEIDQRPDGSIFIHQSSYCKYFVEKFNMEEVNILHIPTDPQHSLDPSLSGSLEAGESSI
ncbi:hypothetical protein QTP88_028560 [Uroleucon formosanum]